MIKTKTVWLIFLGLFLGVFYAVANNVFTDNNSAVMVGEMPEVSETGPLDFPALLNYWSDAIKISGGKEAYTKFLAAYGRYNIHRQHELAHVFGEALYKTVGIDGVAVCDSNFAFGCYHSFFGWAIQEKGLDILSDLDLACIKVHGEKGLGCQHGIGHGVLTELGKENLYKSLDACATLTWKEPIGGCTSGVFMEYNFGTMEDNKMRELTEENLYLPCTDMEERFSQACYFEQPAWWLANNREDYKLVGELCDALVDERDKVACFRGAGNTFAGSLKYSIQDITSACEEMPHSEGRILCTEGATWIVSAQPEFIDTWRNLCEPYKDDKEYYSRCIKSHEFI